MSEGHPMRSYVAGSWIGRRVKLVFADAQWDDATGVLLADLGDWIYLADELGDQVKPALYRAAQVMCVTLAE